MVIHKNILIAALVLLFVAPAPVRAFDVMEDGWGNELSWSKTNIPWYLHPSGSADVSFTELQSAISSAFQEWKSTSCFTKNFTYGGAQNNDPQNGIYVRFQETTWDPVVGDAAAYAQTWKSGGNISHAVVMFNGKDLQWTVSEASDYFSSKSDIQGVATHEFGHCLGLDHSVHLEATMYFSGGSAELRSLETDDKNGICYLYGNFTQGQPCDSCSSDANCASGYCLQYPDGDHYCGKNCTSDANCSENFYCYDMPSGSDQCVSYNSYCNQMGSNIPVGSYCWGHETCASGICLVLPGVAYCSKECSSDSQCTNGLKCIAGYCIKGGNTPLGGDCQSHMDCKSGLCMGLGFGEAICTQECDGPSGCPSGFGCNNGYCFAGGAGDYGSPCDTDMQCASVSCYNIGGGEKICTFLCETKSDCPNQDNCTNTLCIPKGSGAFGEDCDSHMDCQTGYCAGYGSGKFCSFQCSLDSQCPSGSECNL